MWSKQWRRGLVAFFLVGFLGTSTRAQEPLSTSEEYWHRQVEPLLDRSCLKCHAGVRQQGGLDLRSLQTILRGGDSGPAIVPGKPDESRLVKYVLPQPGPHMPPDPKKQLAPEAITALKNWIALLPPQGKQPVPEYMESYRRSLPSLGTPPANLAPSATIDWFLQASWKKDKLTPARVASEAALARRLYLDLAGRIPTGEELKQFVGDYHGDKRERLVEKLLASEDYPKHFGEVFDTLLMGRGVGKNGAWSAYLEDVFRANRPWNAVVRELVIARPVEGNATSRGAVWFLAARNNSFQAMAEAVAPVAFGVKIGCAQCHNHPLAWEIEQRHYWGLVAAFNRSKNVDTDSGTGVSESAIGGFINFANLKKESQPASLVFLNGTSVPERTPAADEKEVDKPELYAIPAAKGRAAVPKFSRREALADSVTKANPLLARAFVNRIWAKLMGRGFTQPVDQLDSKHRISQPELLEWLAKDFETSGYDIKRLVHSVVLTRAYQLDSKSIGKAPPPPESFARALEKPLSAEQLLRSLQVATGTKADNPETQKLEQGFVKAFPELMPDTYNPSLQQALFLTNSPLVDKLLKPLPGNTTTKLAALPMPEARVRAAFQVAFGRAPDTSELTQCQAILTAAPSSERGVQNLLWALVTSAEFQVNH